MTSCAFNLLCLVLCLSLSCDWPCCRYIARDCVEEWRRARPNIEVRWVAGGHVTGALLQFASVRSAIQEVLEEPFDAR